MDAIDQKVSKRDEEQKRILQLKQRLDALKKDSSNDRLTKEELLELHKKCESILSLTRRIADSIEEKICTDRKELEILRKTLESKASAVGDVKNLQEQIHTLEQSNAELQGQCDSLSQNNAEETEWRQKYQTEQKRADSAERKLKEIQSSSRKELTSSQDSTDALNENENEEKGSLSLLELKYQNSKLVSQIKHLQCTFENEEALARALYGNLAAEAIPNPNRCGYLTKQGGAVKSWKRRFFVLKDNFLFYYKKPKDDSPTGVIQLEGSTTEEVPPAEEKKNCFKIITGTRVWLLQADRQIEMDIWIDCLSNAETWWAKESATDTLTKPVRRDTHTRKKKGSFRLTMYLGDKGSLRKAGST